MGLLSKIKEVQEELTFKFPDGDEVRLRVVDAMSIIPRLGLPPATLSKFMEGQKSEVEKRVEHEKALQNVIEDPSLIGVGQRFEEAYWVLGIESVNGEPIKLCFSDESEPDAIPVSTFKAAVVKGYGEEVLQELERAIKRASGYVLPEEVQANAEAFQGVAAGAAQPGESLRHEPD